MADTKKSGGLLGGVKRRLAVLRGRSAVLDHGVRAYDRNSEVLAGQLAAAITYFGFLSFFPVVALAFVALGFVVEVYEGARDQVTSVINENLPGLVGPGDNQIDIDQIGTARTGASIFGVLGLLYAGTGWVSAIRDALRTVFGTGRDTRNIVVKKLSDVLVLVLLGAAVLVSVAVSGVATAATELVLDGLGLSESLLGTVLLRVLGIGASLLLDMVILSVLLSRLAGEHIPFRRIRGGAFVGAIGLELLKLLAGVLLSNTTSNPIYGTFAIVVGLLVWMNFISRLFVFAACWAATEPYELTPTDPNPEAKPPTQTTPLAEQSDPLLAGTAPREAIARAGLTPTGEGGGRAGSGAGAGAGSTVDSASRGGAVAVDAAAPRRPGQPSGAVKATAAAGVVVGILSRAFGRRR